MYTRERGPSPALCLGGLPKQQVPGPRAKTAGQRRAEESLPSLLLSLHRLLLPSISQVRCEQMQRARSAGSAPRSPERKL